MNIRALPAVAFLVPTLLLAADPPEPKFRAVTIDDKIQIGYGLAVADVDGDKLPDILLADKKQIVWYRNPGPAKAAEAGAWAKFIIAENLTAQDNVCLAAQDIDGDGKCELAVGAEWNPGDTVNSGAVFYLIPPADRTQRWEPVKFPSVEPTTHRMKWVKLDEKNWGLVVVPLHGRGNKNGEGAGVRVLLYHPPTPLSDPKGEWKSELIDDSMHMTHNFEVIRDRNGEDATVLLCGKEGLILKGCVKGEWQDVFGRFPKTSEVPNYRGAGEVRLGKFSSGSWFYACIEPMHGNSLAVYLELTDAHPRFSLTDRLTEGHALACGDFLGTGSDQIAVGWRGNGKPGSTTGVAVWSPVEASTGKWRETVIDPTGMACEDLQLADLDGDGKLDIVASGRATKNVKIYFNETPR